MTTTRKKNKEKVGWKLHSGEFELHFNGKFYDQVAIAGVIFKHTAK